MLEEFKNFVERAYKSNVRVSYKKKLLDGTEFVINRKTYINRDIYALFGEIRRPYKFSAIQDESAEHRVELIAIGTNLTPKIYSESDSYKIEGQQLNPYRICFFLNRITKEVFSPQELDAISTTIKTSHIIDTSWLLESLDDIIITPERGMAKVKLPGTPRKGDMKASWINDKVLKYFFVSDANEMKLLLASDLKRCISNILSTSDEMCMYEAKEKSNLTVYNPFRQDTWENAIVRAWLAAMCMRKSACTQFDLSKEVQKFCDVVMQKCQKEKAKKRHPACRFLDIYNKVRAYDTVNVKFINKYKKVVQIEVKASAFQDYRLYQKDCCLNIVQNPETGVFENREGVLRENVEWWCGKGINWKQQHKALGMWHMLQGKWLPFCIPYKQIQSIAHRGKIIWSNPFPI